MQVSAKSVAGDGVEKHALYYVRPAPAKETVCVWKHECLESSVSECHETMNAIHCTTGVCWRSKIQMGIKAVGTAGLDLLKHGVSKLMQVSAKSVKGDGVENGVVYYVRPAPISEIVKNCNNRLSRRDENKEILVCSEKTRGAPR